MKKVKRKLAMKQVMFLCLALLLVMCYMPTSAFAKDVNVSEKESVVTDDKADESDVPEPTVTKDSKAGSSARSDDDDSDGWNYKVGLVWTNGSDEGTTVLNEATTSRDKRRATFELNLSTNKKSYAAGEVEIRIPLYLYKYRALNIEGNDIGPKLDEVNFSLAKAPAETKKFPFNYTVDEDTQEIVITNYTTVRATSNFTFSGQYEIDPYKTIDGTSAKMKANVKTTSKGVEEKINSNSITYNFDSGVVATAAVKQSPTVLRSWDAVENVMKAGNSEFVSKPEPADFDDYWYVSYYIRGDFSGNQPVNLTFIDSPQNKGKMVYNAISKDTSLRANINNYLGNGNYASKVIVKYPKSEGKELTNDLEFKVKPIDGKDEETTKTVSCKHVVSDYEFEYKGFGYTGPLYKVSKGVNQNRSESRVLPLFLQGNDYPLPKWTLQGDAFAYKLDGYNIGTYRADLIDDFMEWRPSDGQFVEMTPDDYYHKSITLRFRNEHPKYTEAGSDYTYRDDKYVTVYAMIKGSKNWTKVEDICEAEWKSGDQKVDLPTNTYRVKVSTDYLDDHLMISGSLDTVIKGDSPTLKKWKKEDPELETKSISIRNFDAFMVYNKAGKLLNPISEANHISNSIEDKERVLKRDRDTYGDLVHRQVYTENLLPLEEQSSAGKSMSQGKVSSELKQVEVNCRLEGNESYRTDSDYERQQIGESGLLNGRDECVFYDLLPLGMTYKPESAQATTIWDVKANVENVETKDNYKGTGRQLLIVKVKGENTGNIWRAGFKLNFVGIVDYENVDLVNNETNIAAYQTGKELIGNSSVDTGEDFAAAKLVETNDGSNVFNNLAGDGNADGKKDTLYMSASTGLNVLTTTESGLTLDVCQGDSTSGNPFVSEISTDLGGKYTYRLNVTNNSSEGSMKDVILFNKLEKGANTEGNSGETSWKGTLDSVNTKYLEAQGIKPEIYYSKNSNPKPFTIKEISAKAVPSGWIKGDPSKLSNKEKANVTAVAVDISQKTDGSDYVFSRNTSTAAYIVMKAPNTSPSAEYAYNYGTFYSQFTPKTGASYTQTNNTPRVKVGLRNLKNPNSGVVNKVPLNNNTNGPKTGDETALGLWIMLLIVAAGACGCIVGIKRRQSKEK